MKLTPLSSAARSAASASDSLTGPHAEPIGQVPIPISATCHPVLPNCRFFIFLPQSLWDQAVMAWARARPGPSPFRRFSDQVTMPPGGRTTATVFRGAVAPRFAADRPQAKRRRDGGFRTGAWPHRSTSAQEEIGRDLDGERPPAPAPRSRLRPKSSGCGFLRRLATRAANSSTTRSAPAADRMGIRGKTAKAASRNRSVGERPTGGRPRIKPANSAGPRPLSRPNRPTPSK